MDRYKFKNSKFISASDAKKLRVLQAQDNRKLLRSNTFFQNRVMTTPSAKNEVLATPNPSTTKCKTLTEDRSTKKYSTKELTELSNLRYQKMLLYKEQKKQKKEIDKKKRQPVFHSGLYQPDVPSFLSAKKKKIDALPKSTPYKSASRLNMAGSTPAATKSKKSLRFTTGPASSIKNVSTTKKENASTRVTGSAKRVEVALAAEYSKKVPLKVSPKNQKSVSKAVLSERNKTFSPARKIAPPKRIPTPAWRQSSSFAPKNFKFSGVTGVEPINFNSMSYSNLPKKQHTKRKMKEDKENFPDHESIYLSPPKKSHHLNQSSAVQPQVHVSFHEQTPENAIEFPRKTHLSSLRRRRMSKQATPLEKSFQDIKFDSPLPLHFSDEEDTEGSFKNGNETLSDAEVKLVAVLDRPRCEEFNLPSENEADEPVLISPVEKKEPNDEINISPKSIMKKKKKVNMSVSFVMEKCSEKKPQYKGTPLPRKSTRLTRQILLSGLDDTEEKPLQDSTSGQQDLTNIETPKSAQRKKKTTVLSEEPIPKGNLSSLQRRRLTKKVNPLEKMFLDIPNDSLTFSDDGSPDCVNETLSDAEVKLMDLLEPSESQETDHSSENYVWSPDTSKNDIPIERKNSIKVSEEDNKSRKSIIKKERKSSMSVSFVTTKDSGNKILHKGTPIPRRSNRIARLSLLPGLYNKGSPVDAQTTALDPSQDLMNFDTPKSAPRKKRKRSSRLTALPDFTIGDEPQSLL